jgi:hypothetical protein
MNRSSAAEIGRIQTQIVRLYQVFACLIDHLERGKDSADLRMARTLMDISFDDVVPAPRHDARKAVQAQPIPPLRDTHRTQ